MRPTIYDVAEKAGVSIATVSKVINNTGRIGEKTKEKVLEVMSEIKYHPSVVASALTGKRTNTIGLLIPDIANPFFAELARSVEDRGHENGFSVVMCNTDNELQKETKYIQWLKQKSVDGIIIATGIQNEMALQELIDQNIPIALIARDMPSLVVDSVLVDDFLGGHLATSHLIELGHKKIVAVVGDDNTVSEKERLRGYRHALKESGIQFNEELIIKCGQTIEGAKQALKKHLTKGNTASAIFAFNDLLAIGAIQGAREFGLSIPDDLSVVGFDNTILATIHDPSLTTIAQPIHDMGAQVIDLLIQEIEGHKQAKRRVVLLPELVVRHTTAAVLKQKIKKVK